MFSKIVGLVMAATSTVSALETYTGELIRDKVSKSQHPGNDGQCKRQDKYGNCAALAQNCCKGISLGSGIRMGDACCNACKKTDKLPKCAIRFNTHRKGIQAIRFSHKQPRFGIQANNRCSKSESRLILDSQNNAEHIIRSAYKNWDKNPKLFKKWFGTGSAHNNENVKIRYKHAMDLMFEDTREWTMMCCKKAIGGCKSCTGRTLAYVLSRKMKFGSTHMTNVRFCKLSFKQKDRNYLLGMTLFHEMMHMASSAGDKGYSKVQCLDNAVRRPEYARHNAQAYFYYASEAGQQRKNYLRHSGGAAMSPKCFDKYSNCPSIARGCCHKKGWNKTDTYAKSCCASCAWVDAAKRCGGTRLENPDRAADRATIREAKIAAVRRRLANDARRCKEDMGGSACNPAALARIRKDKAAVIAKAAAVKLATRVARALRLKKRIARAKQQQEKAEAARKKANAEQQAAMKEKTSGLSDSSKNCAKYAKAGKCTSRRRLCTAKITKKCRLFKGHTKCTRTQGPWVCKREAAKYMKLCTKTCTIEQAKPIDQYSNCSLFHKYCKTHKNIRTKCAKTCAH